jgi:hypothetical protein
MESYFIEKYGQITNKHYLHLLRNVNKTTVIYYYKSTRMTFKNKRNDQKHRIALLSVRVNVE